MPIRGADEARGAEVSDDTLFGWQERLPTAGPCRYNGGMLKRFALLTWLLLPALGCSEAPPESEPTFGVRFDYVSLPGCRVLEAGTLPPQVTLLDLTLFRASDREPIQEAEILVDPGAMCSDDAGNEFPCPFDVDRDGERERFFAFEPTPMDEAVVVVVSMKDSSSEVLWTGHSDPVTIRARGATVVEIELHPTEAICPEAG